MSFNQLSTFSCRRKTFMIFILNKNIAYRLLHPFIFLIYLSQVGVPEQSPSGFWNFSHHAAFDESKLPKIYRVRVLKSSVADSTIHPFNFKVARDDYPSFWNLHLLGGADYIFVGIALIPSVHYMLHIMIKGFQAVGIKKYWFSMYYVSQFLA